MALTKKAFDQFKDEFREVYLSKGKTGTGKNHRFGHPSGRLCQQKSNPLRCHYQFYGFGQKVQSGREKKRN
jgi:hypothetical protein